MSSTTKLSKLLIDGYRYSQGQITGSQVIDDLIDYYRTNSNTTPQVSRSQEQVPQEHAPQGPRSQEQVPQEHAPQGPRSQEQPPQEPRSQELANFTKYQDEVAAENAEENTICVICKSHRRNILLLPCSHAVTCVTCTKALRDLQKYMCPICRKPVKQAIHYFQ